MSWRLPRHLPIEPTPCPASISSARHLVLAAARADTLKHGSLRRPAIFVRQMHWSRYTDADDHSPNSTIHGANRHPSAGCVPSAALAYSCAGTASIQGRVTLVPITALVRDSRNRIVRNLGPEDFQVLEGGRPRPIVDFGANDKAPINVAFLFDTSGSMQVASNMARGKDFVEEFVVGIETAADAVALYTFDKSLRREVSFTNDRDKLYDALDGVKPWGLTSLYDAIAETAKQLGDRTSQRRAVVVVTDGADTSSALTPAEVSGLASSIDVPVYVVAVVSPLDHPGAPAAVVADSANGGLENVANWTGGQLFYVSGPEQTPVVAKELLRTMRHQVLAGHRIIPITGRYHSK